MKTLTLEHLAPYLPYGLKARMSVPFDEITMTEIVGLSEDYAELIGIRETVTEHFEFKDIKPILRPLSDLSKEIEHNGEKFLPILELYKWSNERNYNDKFDFEFIDSWGAGKILKVYHDKERNSFTEFIYNKFSFRKTRLYNKGAYNFGMDLPHNISVSSEIHNQYILFQKLLEWHFDIYGLIEQGLAIDINTLEK